MEDLIAETLANPLVTGALSAVGIAVVALWLAAAWWAYADAARRTDSALAALTAAGWIVMSTPLLLPFSLAIYTLARPQHTASEHRSRRLVAELVDELDTQAASGPACPSCALAADPAWLRCPACSTWLALPCASCGGWSDGALDICPWCGHEERSRPAVESAEPELEPAGIPARGRRARRALRAMGPGRAVDARPGRRGVAVPETRPLTTARGR